MELDKGGKIIVVFGCEARRTVPNLSSIANTFFVKLREATAENGCLIIPDAKGVFGTWVPNEHERYTGSIELKTAKILHLLGPDPESDELYNRGADQVFDYSRMSGRYFKPDERICLIFENHDYSGLRSIEAFEKYKDLPACID